MPTPYRFVLLLGSLLLAGPAGSVDLAQVKQLLNQLHDKDISVRQTALRELNKMGAESAEATDLLIASLAEENQENRQIITGILSKIGKGAVPGLTKALGKDTLVVRRQALLALGRIGPAAQSATPAVSAALKDPNKEIRSFAVTTIVLIDPEGPNLVPALKQALEDPERGVRLGALYSLEEVARKNAALQPLLVGALENQEWEVRLAAAALLSRLGGEIKSSVPALTTALGDADGRVRNSVALALVTLAPTQTAGPLKVLLANLEHAEPDIRRGAAYVLGEIGPDAQPAIPKLKELAKDERPEVRQAAQRALERIPVKQ